MIQLRFASIEFTPDGAVSRFGDDSEYGARPHPELPHYQYLAYRYGHDGDTLAYCQVHELAHWAALKSRLLGLLNPRDEGDLL